MPHCRPRKRPNLSGSAAALGVIKTGTPPVSLRADEVPSYSVRLCNFHASWWPQKSGPLGPMRIGRHFSRAWGDTVPLVWPDMNTTQVNEGAHGLMDGLTHAFAPVHRAYFRYVASPESEVAFDTNKTYQIMCNLYSAGAIDILQNPLSFNSARPCSFAITRRVASASWSTALGKLTTRTFPRRNARSRCMSALHQTRQVGQTRSAHSTACLGFDGRMLAFSIPVGRVGGYGTFMGPSDLPCGKDRTAREESCTLRAAAVARACELLRLVMPNHGEANPGRLSRPGHGAVCPRI